MLSSACAVNFISDQLPVLDEKEWEAELGVLLRMRSKFHLLPVLDEKEWEAELEVL